MSASNMRPTPTNTNRPTQRAEATQSNSPEDRASSQGSMDQVLDLRKSSSPEKPCIWCGKHSTFCSATDNGIGAEFCSEVCFDQFRRDSFKKRSACIWCNNSITNNSNGSGPGSLVNINLNSNVDETKFCSESCLAQYKVRLFCEETSAHLDQIKNSKNGGANIGIGGGLPNGNENGTDLITPDLWLKKLPNGFLGSGGVGGGGSSGSGIERSSPHSSSSSDLSPSALFSPNYALNSGHNESSSVCPVAPSSSPAAVTVGPSTSGRRLQLELGDASLSPGKLKSAEVSPRSRVNCKPCDQNFTVINDPFSHSNYLSSVKRSRGQQHSAAASAATPPPKKKFNMSYPIISNFINQNQNSASVPMPSQSPIPLQLVQPMEAAAAASAQKMRAGRKSGSRNYRIRACNLITTTAPTTPSLPSQLPLIIHPGEVTFIKPELFARSGLALQESSAPTAGHVGKGAKFQDSAQLQQNKIFSNVTSANGSGRPLSLAHDSSSFVFASTQTDESRINVASSVLSNCIPISSRHPTSTIFDAFSPRAVVFLPYPVPLPIPMPIPMLMPMPCESPLNFQNTDSSTLQLDSGESEREGFRIDPTTRGILGKDGKVLRLDVLDDLE